MNRSHLIGNDEYGMPLFDGVAHRFVVRVYEGAALSDERLRALTTVLERERPAHTDYVVCRVAPQFEIGVQARVGIDAIVGGAPLPAAATATSRASAKTSCSAANRPGASENAARSA